MGHVSIYYGEVIERQSGGHIVRVHHDGAVDEYPVASYEDGMITLEAKLSQLEDEATRH